MSPSPSPPDRPREGGFWRSLILWALLALLTRWLVVEPRWIPSGSMLPTLQLQDRILVEKIRPPLEQQRGRQLIKRLVGHPGDQLEVRDGLLIRNGEPVPEPWLDEPITYAMAPVTVPDHQLWVMGDNRNASLDSHLWGPLPEANVIGTAIWRYWPLNRFGPIRFSTTDGIESNSEAGVGSGP